MDPRCIFVRLTRQMSLSMPHLLALLLCLFAAKAAVAQIYSMYVANESDDTVMLVEFDGQTLAVTDTIAVGLIHTEIEGPHGLAIDPEGKSLFVSIAHGQPNGSVVRYSTADHRPMGAATLGLFPASMAISPHTGLLYVVNFNLHGDPEPSSISVVDPEMMLEVSQIPTGIMPHGSAFGTDGTRHYSVAMMDHILVELDALNLRVLRKIPLGMGTKPTWVALHPHEPQAYVAANGSDQIVIVNTEEGSVLEQIPASGAPYNLAVSPDGSTLVVTLKNAQAVSILDLSTLAERARVPTSSPIPHGVVITPDNEYAFVTSEGIGAAPGTVDVVHLASAMRVASIQAGQQTGGIALWKMED